MWRRVKAEDYKEELQKLRFSLISVSDIYFLIKNSREINLKDNFVLASGDESSCMFSSKDDSCLVTVHRMRGKSNEFMKILISRFTSDGLRDKYRTIWYKLETPQEEQERKRKHGDYSNLFQDWS